EFHVAHFEKFMRSNSPLYIYCLRDPVKVLRSKLNMHLSNRNFDLSLKDLENSVGRALAMRDRIPDRMFIFSVDLYSRCPDKVTKMLLDFLAIDSSPATIASVIDQPAANTMSQQIRSRKVS